MAPKSKYRLQVSLAALALAAAMTAAVANRAHAQDHPTTSSVTGASSFTCWQNNVPYSCTGAQFAAYANSLVLGQANTWPGVQTYSNGANFNGPTALNAGATFGNSTFFAASPGGNPTISLAGGVSLSYNLTSTASCLQNTVGNTACLSSNGAWKPSGGTLGSVGLANVQVFGSTNATETLQNMWSRIYSASDWGVACNGVQDETANIQAAVNYVSAARAAGSLPFGATTIVKLPAGICPIGQPTSGNKFITLPAFVKLEGAGPGPFTGATGGTIIVPKAIDTTQLSAIYMQGVWAHLDNLQIDVSQVASPPTQPWFAISTAYSEFQEITNIEVYGGCGDIDGSGTYLVARDFQGIQVGMSQAASGGVCYGARWGHLGTLGQDTALVLDNFNIQGWFPVGTAGGWNATTALTNGMRFEDSGGAELSNVNVIFSYIGTNIIPGLNQDVMWLFATNSFLGDTGYCNGVKIDTGDPTAVVKSIVINGGWVSANATCPGFVAQNTGGGSSPGTVDGIYLTNFRAFASGFGNSNHGNTVAGVANVDNMQVLANVKNFSLKSSTLCAPAAGGGSASNLNLQASGASIVGNKMGNQCDGWGIAGSTTTGIAVSNNSAYDTIDANDFGGYGPVTTGIALNGSIGVTISGGNIFGSVINGVTMSGTNTNFTISADNFAGATNGIAFGGTNSGGTVSGNGIEVSGTALNFSGTTTTIAVTGNNLSGAATPVSGSPTDWPGGASKISSNVGFVTQNSGTGSVAVAGTSTVITHGMGNTPLMRSISITPTSNPTASGTSPTSCGGWWISNVTSTQFTVNCAASVTTNAFNFVWQISE